MPPLISAIVAAREARTILARYPKTDSTEEQVVQTIIEMANASILRQRSYALA
jgi:hypothetical protein